MISIPPEVVHISGYHFSRNLIGTFDIVAASNYSTLCFVDFGDGSMPYKVTSSPEFVSEQNVGHTFLQLGLYHISATCKKNIDICRSRDNNGPHLGSG
jgi:hypothetical protein